MTRAKALYVIDYDLLAVRFAKVNRALLAVSTSRADYVNLRLTASKTFGSNDRSSLEAKTKKLLRLLIRGRSGIRGFESRGTPVSDTFILPHNT